jgi:hypothetical protein
MAQSLHLIVLALRESALALRESVPALRETGLAGMHEEITTGGRGSEGVAHGGRQAA